MIHSANELRQATVRTRGDDSGSVRQILFDDRRWCVRYLVVHAGGWLAGEQVLVPPLFVDRVDAPGRWIELTLTSEQLRNAPPVEAHKTLAEREHDVLGYDGHPAWEGSIAWGLRTWPYDAGGTLAPLTGEVRSSEPATESQLADDAHLRSTDEIGRCRVEIDGKDVGAVDDFLIDDAQWQLDAIVVDPDGGRGETLRMPLQRVRRVDWAARKIVGRAR